MRGELTTLCLGGERVGVRGELTDDLRRKDYHQRMPESPILVSAERGAGISDVEAEHALQYKLLAEAERLLREGDGAGARDVIKQLHDYSDVHFASEQLLMRLVSYPGYNAHEREHGDLLTALRNLLDTFMIEDASRASAALRAWLTTHIQHSDQAFLEFVRSSGKGVTE